MANGPGVNFSFAAEESGGKRAAIFGGLIVAAAAIVVLLWVGLFQKSPERQPPTEEALTYAPQVAFSGLHLSAAENFLGQQVVYLDGKMSNTGSKAVRQLKVRLSFHDLMNQVVLRDEREILPLGPQSLAPGEVQPFRMRFDEIPGTWNQQVPGLQIISLRVQQQ